MDFALVLVIGVALQDSGEATKYVTRAYLRQTKLDEQLDELQRRLLSDEARKNLSMATVVAKVLIEQRISYTWRFP